MCHVIDVGTCCPNLYKQTWAGSSAVQHVLIVTMKVGGLNPQNNQFFLHQIKLNLAQVDSMDSMECSWSPWKGVGECKVLKSVDPSQ